MSGKRKLAPPAPASTSLTCGKPLERVYNLVDPQYEVLDPNPDIHALFLEYNAMFFDGTLAGCEVKWSKRMTLCAGLCSYQPSSGFCSIRLSEPLLKLRPRSDLINTLLHEMIHAYIFVSSPVRDHEDHGPVFQSHMHRINQLSGTVITVYHTFHDEVDSYRQHWWQCDGPCQRKPPYFGLVKRAMNRPPGPLDRWWEDHEKSCRGTYTKIKEPPGFKEKQAKKLLAQQKKKEKEKKTPSVKNFFPALLPPPSDDGTISSAIPVKKPKPSAKKPKVEKPEPASSQTNPTRSDEGRANGPVLPSDSNSTGLSFTVPDGAVLVAGDDGDFFLIGDGSAIFQGARLPPSRIHRLSGDRTVDLTQSDEEEERTEHDTKRSGRVEVIEID